MTLDDVLDDGPWIRREKPFPHVLVPRVFRPEIVAGIEATVRSLVRSTAMHHFGWFDAYSCGFADALGGGALEVFVSRPFHDLIAERMAVPALGYVNGGVHHHHRGSRSGFIHNDLNPVYFAGEPTREAVVLPRRGGEFYTHGTGAPPGAAVHEVVRCTTLIYYTANPSWRLGDGGETALYSRAGADPDAPAAVVPPVNNSMLIFNCAGSSYHAFRTNRRTERTSIIMWLHASVADMAAAHGWQAFVRFRNR